jgi:Zn ribbon nucleic-acid-binding protein
MRNEYEFKCPQCNAESKFNITAQHTIEINDDGLTGDGDDHLQWVNGDACECMACGYTATVQEFQGESAPVMVTSECSNRKGADMSSRLMTGPEYDTILAALRLLQNHLDGPSHGFTMEDVLEDIIEIMTSSGEHVALNSDAIEQLCEDLQYGVIQTTQQLNVVSDILTIPGALA